MDLKAVLHCVEAKSEWMRSNLRELVLQESLSEDRTTVNAAMAIAERLALDLGGRVRRHRQKAFGDVLELRFGLPRSSCKPLLLLGHLDTVWPIGTLAGMPWRADKGRFCGPRVPDMRAGVGMALATRSTVKELELTPPV